VQKFSKKVSKSVCAVTAVATPNPLFATPSPFSATKTSEDKKEEPDDSEPADKGDIQTECASDSLRSPNTGAPTKNYLYELWLI
jgi:hypothetical protein